MIVLGIDPGTANTGWGLVRAKKSKNSSLQLVGYGCIVTPKSRGMPARLVQLRKELKRLLGQVKPDVVAVEQHFFGINSQTAITVAQARGVILETIAAKKLPIFEYQGLTVKKGLTGNGHADKKEIERVVKRKLGLRKLKKPSDGFLDDAVDGLAMAIYHTLACAS